MIETLDKHYIFVAGYFADSFAPRIDPAYQEMRELKNGLHFRATRTFSQVFQPELSSNFLTDTSILANGIASFFKRPMMCLETRNLSHASRESGDLP